MKSFFLKYYRLALFLLCFISGIFFSATSALAAPVVTNNINFAGRSDNFSLTIVSNPDTNVGYTPGGTITYTLTVKNNRATTEYFDLIIPQSQYKSGVTCAVTDGYGGCGASDLHWSAYISPGGTLVGNLTLSVASTVTGNITLQPTALGYPGNAALATTINPHVLTQAVVIPTENCIKNIPTAQFPTGTGVNLCVTTTPFADLSKTSGVVRGSTLTYNLNIKNTSAANYDMTFDIPLPTQTTFVSSSNGAYDPARNLVEWTAWSVVNQGIMAGQEYNFEITVRVNNSTSTVGDIVFNPNSAGANYAIAINGYLINSALASLKHPILFLERSGYNSPPQGTTVIANDRLHYFYSLTNTSSTTTATNVQLRFNPPPGTNLDLYSAGYYDAFGDNSNAYVVYGNNDTQIQNVWEYYYSIFYNNQSATQQELSQLAANDKGPLSFILNIPTLAPSASVANQEIAAYVRDYLGTTPLSKTEIAQEITLNGQLIEDDPVVNGVVINAAGTFWQNQKIALQYTSIQIPDTPGDAFTQKLKIDNAGGMTADLINKKVTVPLPSGLSYDSSSLSVLLNTGSDMKSVTTVDTSTPGFISFYWTNNLVMPANSYLEITFRSPIDPSLPIGTTFTQQAILTDTNSNNQSHSNFWSLQVVNEIKMGLEFDFLSHQNGASVSRGDRTTFRANILNYTPSKIIDVSVVCPINPKMRIVPGSIYPYFDDFSIIDVQTANSGSITTRQLFEMGTDQIDALGNMTLVFHVDDLPGGSDTTPTTLNHLPSPYDTYKISYQADVKDSATGVINNQCYLNIGGQNQLTQTPLVSYNVSIAELIELYSNPNTVSPVHLGDEIIYTARLKNDSDSATVTDVNVLAHIPAGTTYVPGSITYSYVNADPAAPSPVYTHEETMDQFRLKVDSLPPNTTGGESYIDLTYKVKVAILEGQVKNYISANNNETDQILHQVAKAGTVLTSVTINQNLFDDHNQPIIKIPQYLDGHPFLTTPETTIVLQDTQTLKTYRAVVSPDPVTGSAIIKGLPYDTTFTVLDIIYPLGMKTLSLSSNSFSFSAPSNQRQATITLNSQYQPTGGFSDSDSAANLFNVEDSELYLNDFNLEWLSYIQLPSGAIPMKEDPALAGVLAARYEVRPVFAVGAAEAFLTNPDYYDNALAYIRWHLAHINMSPDRVTTNVFDEPIEGITGSIYDYFISTSGEESVARDVQPDHAWYDSADSYSSLFLKLLNEYAQVIGPTAFQAFLDENTQNAIDGQTYNNQQIIETVAGVITSTGQTWNDSLGLTLTSKYYPVYFLMDNTESFAGFQAMNELCTNYFTDPQTACNTYADRATAVQNAIENELWNESNQQSYDYAWMNPSNNLNRFYPDGLAQLFPILHGLIDPNSDRAKMIYDRFNNDFFTWPSMNGSYDPDGIYPYTQLITVAVMMGDFTRAQEAFQNVETLYLQTSNSMNWFSGESGSLILAQQEFVKTFKEAP